MLETRPPFRIILYWTTLVTALKLSLKDDGKPTQPEPANKKRADKTSRLLEELRALADFNKTASQRMIAIVASLRSFARLDRAVEDQVDMHEGLETTLTLIENQLKDRVAVHKDYAVTPRVRCYPSQLNQVYRGMHFTPDYPTSCGWPVRLPRRCWTISE